MENEKVLLLGKGFVGSRIAEGLGCQVCDSRINTLKDAQAAIDKFKPELIINAIGHTGRNVDDCETDKEKTIFSNTFVPIILAEAAIRNNLRLVHISSGCIYHYDYTKDSPIEENLPPDFFELFYSRSKIYSDEALSLFSKGYPILIVRIRVPLDDRPHPRNILTKLINYKKVINVPNSITYLPDFIPALKHLIKIEARGTYNVVNRSGLRYPDLLDVYKKHVPGFDYEVVDYQKLNMVRTNLILSTEKLEKSGFKVRDINGVLEECVENYLKY